MEISKKRNGKLLNDNVPEPNQLRCNNRENDCDYEEAMYAASQVLPTSESIQIEEELNGIHVLSHDTRYE